MCQCDSCVRHRRFREAVDNKDFDCLVEIINGLEDQLSFAVTDAEYYESILDGSWPNAGEILRNALDGLPCPNL